MIRYITERDTIQKLPGEWLAQMYLKTKGKWLEEQYQRCYETLLAKDLNVVSLEEIQSILESYIPRFKSRQHRWLFAECSNCGQWVSSYVEIDGKEADTHLCRKCAKMVVDVVEMNESFCDNPKQTK
jgi:hypothetical protein